MRRPDNQKLIAGPAPPVKRSGISFVSAFWLVATFFLTSGLIVAGGFPYWIVNRVDGAPNSVQSRDLNIDYSALVRVDLGLYYLCYQLFSGIPECGTGNVCNGNCSSLNYCGCTTYMNFNPQSHYITADGLFRMTRVSKAASIKEYAWLFAASIVYAFGVFMLVISFITGICALFKPRIGKSCSLFITAFVFQIFAGVALVISFFLVPVFFGSDFAKQFCGSHADYYQKGQCSIDWSLYVGMVVSACSLYLPALAVFSLNISDGVKAPVCC